MFISERLDTSHQIDTFNSGAPSLDLWLQQSALIADQKRQGRTYVWSDEDRVVVAYYTLAPHVIERAELSAKMARGNLNQIPALLLARLALDLQYHGRGLGAELLADALSRAVLASNFVGGRFIVVDALDEQAGRFYEHYGFARCGDTATHRYVRKVSDIAASLG